MQVWQDKVVFCTMNASLTGNGRKDEDAKEGVEQGRNALSPLGSRHTAVSHVTRRMSETAGDGSMRRGMQNVVGSRRWTE